MALFEINFKHVEYFYRSETIEAESKEQAEAIALRLLDSEEFDLMENNVYEDHEDSFIQAYEVERFAGRYERHETMGAEDIARYLGEE